MEKVVIDSSEILSSAWEQAKKNGLALAVIFFVISIIQSAISGAGFDYVAYIEAIKENDALALQNMMGGNSAMSYLSWVVYAVLMIGFNRMILLIVTGVKSSPSFVNSIPLLLLKNNVPPNCSSSFFIDCEIAG